MSFSNPKTGVLKKTEVSKQVMLIILDGWGHRTDSKHNAVASANTPNFKKYWDTFPHTLLEASGLAVGLPEGQMGNSEIGHTTIGAGKTIDTDLVRIKKSIDNGAYDKNFAFVALFDHVKKYNSMLHVQGLLGDGGVHSHSDHLFAFIKTAKKAGIKRIAIHVFTDGRDTAPQSSAKYVQALEKFLEEINDETHMSFIATISGRFFAMDRDNNWERLSKVEQALFEAKGNICEIKPSEYLSALHKEGKIDEHLEPIICTVPNKDTSSDGSSSDSSSDHFSDPANKHESESLRSLSGASTIKDNDAVFFFNFRADRARMLSSKMLKKVHANNVRFATLTSYGNEFTAEAGVFVAFPPALIETTLAKEISGAGMTQAHIAETEKFPHATYFLNGGVEKPYDLEKHIMLDSRKDVQTHDQAPEMRAEAIADKAIEEIKAGTNFIFINFANPDMVGHTANVPAIIKAVEKVDLELGRVIEALHSFGGIAFITADHGNAEVNIDINTGEKHTAHTTNPVPAIWTNKGDTLKVSGTLADIAPTIIKYLNISKPETMTGKSIVI